MKFTVVNQKCSWLFIKQWKYILSNGK